MTDLKCSVETCCFHDGDCCCRNDIMVGGAKACSCDETCCENFEQQKEGSARNADGYPDRMTQIDCEAVKCRYNTNYKCQAEHVDMRGSRAGENGQEKSYRSSKKVDIVFLSLSDVNLFRIACLKSSATKPSFKF